MRYFPSYLWQLDGGGGGHIMIDDTWHNDTYYEYNDYDAYYGSLLGAAGDSLSLDGENSSDCGVVPSMERETASREEYSPSEKDYYW